MYYNGHKKCTNRELRIVCYGVVNFILSVWELVTEKGKRSLSLQTTPRYLHDILNFPFTMFKCVHDFFIGALLPYSRYLESSFHEMAARASFSIYNNSRKAIPVMSLAHPVAECCHSFLRKTGTFY